jgi:hypothetical protein
MARHIQDAVFEGWSDPFEGPVMDMLKQPSEATK